MKRCQINLFCYYSKMANAWLSFLSKFRKDHPSLSMKQAMKQGAVKYRASRGKKSKGKKKKAK